MFSLDVVNSDAFLDMPLSAQALYYHLGMRADDDGFVPNPRRIQVYIGASADDLKLLAAKRFILTFPSGIIVIKHWRLHNHIRKDRYKPTLYQEEKRSLFVKKNGVYTDHPLPPGEAYGEKSLPEASEDAEEGWMDGPIVEGIASRYLGDLFSPERPDRPDTLVLGCTHFPLFREALRHVVGEDVRIVDSAETAAVAVEDRLRELDLLRREDAPGTHRFMTTDNVLRFIRTGSLFLGHPLKSAEVSLVDLS